MVAITPSARALATAFIKVKESCRLTAYLDSNKVWTIGWGQTGKHIVQGLVWTQAFADAELDARITEIALDVAIEVTVPITNHQIAALISFSYNIGMSQFDTSTLLADIDANNLADVPRQFGRWIHDGGKVVQGLINRRNAEIALWNTPDN